MSRRNHHKCYQLSRKRCRRSQGLLATYYTSFCCQCSKKLVHWGEWLDQYPGTAFAHQNTQYQIRCLVRTVVSPLSARDSDNLRAGFHWIKGSGTSLGLVVLMNRYIVPHMK